MVGRFQISDPVCIDSLGETWAGYIADGDEGGRIVLVTLGEFPEGGRVASALSEAARRSAKIRHPNVLAFLEAYQVGPELAFVSEYLDGEPLSALMRVAAVQAAPLSQGVALQILREAIDTLSVLKEEHPLVVLPGALSPESIFVASFGEIMLRQPGVLGTGMRAPSLRRHPASLPYRAPEHLMDPRSISDLADVYSAGVLLWEMLAGKPLFGEKGHLRLGRVKALPDEDIAAMEERCMGMPAPPLQKVPRAGGALHPAVTQLVERALDRDPTKRPQSLRELSQAILDLPPGLLASSLEISNVVERLAGPAIARRKQILSERAPMPVYGSRPPSARISLPPEDQPKAATAISSHPSPQGLQGLTGTEDPAPSATSPTTPPDSRRKTSPMRPDFPEEDKTTSPDRRRIMEQLGRVREGVPPVAAAQGASPRETATAAPLVNAAGGTFTAASLRQSGAPGDSHSPVVRRTSTPGLDEDARSAAELSVIANKPKKRGAGGWLLASLALLAVALGVGYLILGRGAFGTDASSAGTAKEEPTSSDTQDSIPTKEANAPSPEPMADDSAQQPSKEATQGEPEARFPAGSTEKGPPPAGARDSAPGEGEPNSKPGVKAKGSGKAPQGTSTDGAFRPDGI